MDIFIEFEWNVKITFPKINVKIDGSFYGEFWL